MEKELSGWVCLHGKALASKMTNSNTLGLVEKFFFRRISHQGLQPGLSFFISLISRRFTTNWDIGSYCEKIFLFLFYF